MSDILLSEDPKQKGNNSHLIENESVSIDVTMLYDVSGSDPKFIQSAVQAFLRNMPAALNKIEESLHTQDWDKVYKLSHSVRSSLSIIKINEVFDLVIQVEENAKNRVHLDSIAGLISKIKEKYISAEAALNERFNA